MKLRVSEKTVRASTFDRLSKKITSGELFAGWANRRLLKLYSEFQKERWATKGRSEGMPWMPLNPEYKRRKLSLFQGYPLGGKRDMVATNRLLSGVLPPSERKGLLAVGEDFRKLVDKKRRVVKFSTGVPYAVHANEERNFDHYTETTREFIRQDFKKYIRSQLIKGGK